ncbi:LAMI_0G04214g1_1 [Lachancea mirantina]|uniref:non-specific serine/threonine protein kinase n=1 Tax=Lachancea mirantina TaxID=1230905 RepID=A0A1G4K8I6_9SACH|nr:LAMI_0G04214g1_1 [Lachancea mirantina]
MSMARQAALAASGQSDHLERVVQSVTDATKRLSQISSSTTNTTTNSSKRRSRDTIGPWKLGKTLGKGSSGRVRLAKNMETGKLAAVKIVPKTKSARPNTLPYGIEREIIIMKLISHSNVMGLYEVWENRFELFLVLEYVDGGELFDYLVSRGRLPEREAIHYFRQIIEGMAFCHSFNICHRDLKPENLLLDKKNGHIKIADFGMAALQTSNKLLETSCGSPHYASPEIVMGKTYHGGPSDVWSCGIVLFALLTGHLPFNDDNIKRLLLKVQSGRYKMPQNISPEAKNLISRILIVDPIKRITVDQILAHPLLTKYGSKTKPESSKSKNNRPSNISLTKKEDIDDTILQNLQILWHGASKDHIVSQLLKEELTDEKMFYSLLIEYQQRQKKQKNSNNLPTDAPKLLQKSQFSVPSIKSQHSPRKEHVASSSRLFSSSSRQLSHKRMIKKNMRASPSSRSVTSMKSSASKKSLKSSSSKRSIKSSTAHKTGLTNHDGSALQPSETSFYSLKSISKRSVNLKDYLHEDGQNSSVPQRSEFEVLCDELLFGGGLDGIKEEEDEEVLHDLLQEQTLQSAAAAKENVKPEIKKEEKPVSSKIAPLQPASPKVEMRQRNQPIRITSEPFAKMSPDARSSLDPRRNVSQPNSLEMLLSKYTYRASLNSATNLKSVKSRRDLHHELSPQDGARNRDSPVNETSANYDVGNLTSMLAQSSTIKGAEMHSRSHSTLDSNHPHRKPLTSMPSVGFSASSTFKNLNQFIIADSSQDSSEVINRKRAGSERQTLAPGPRGVVSRKVSQASSGGGHSEEFSDMTYAMEIPTQILTAQAVQISNGSSVEQLELLKNRHYQKNAKEDEVNIFEDAPDDTFSVATSSSDSESQPHVHRKATSLDSLSNNNVLTKPTDVRVSLYVNNVASTVGLPRETTEEIISKMKLSPEKVGATAPKRNSQAHSAVTISKSMVSMFKDFEDTKYGKDDSVDDSLELKYPEGGAEKENRVTMLFDDEAGNVFKASPTKPNKTSQPSAVEPIRSDASENLGFKKNRLSTVVECEKQESHAPVPVLQRPAPPAPSSQKPSWFRKLFDKVVHAQNRDILQQEHLTKSKFEDVQIVMLREFYKFKIDFKLKRLDKKNGVSSAVYNCEFEQGHFKFKINMRGNSAGTEVVVKKKGLQNREPFTRFNSDIARVLREELSS